MFERSWKTLAVSGIVAIILLAAFRISIGTNYQQPSVMAAAGSVQFTVGTIEPNIYVVSLNGVDMSGVANATDVLVGANQTVYTDAIHDNSIIQGSYFEIPVNISVTLVSDWTTYESLVENATNVIIINVHGATLPVPSGYTKEAWVDMIADSMLHRNVTWVQVAGYPFYYYALEDGGNDAWGEEGFSRLMQHTGKNNVTCVVQNSMSSNLIRIDIYASVALGDFGFIGEAFRVEDVVSLKGGDFVGDLMLPIYGLTDTHVIGAVISFGNETGSCFYVQLGFGQTYTDGLNATDSDYCRGWVGGAAAVWAYALKVASDRAISFAEARIDQAIKDGRTQGLDEAANLVNQSENAYLFHGFNGQTGAIALALKAAESADMATEPSSSSTGEYDLYMTTVIIGGAVATGGSIAFIARKRSGKKILGRKSNELAKDQGCLFVQPSSCNFVHHHDATCSSGKCWQRPGKSLHHMSVRSRRIGSIQSF